MRYEVFLFDKFIGNKSEIFSEELFTINDVVYWGIPYTMILDDS